MMVFINNIERLAIDVIRPLVPRAWHLLFPAAEKVGKKAIAASAAFKVIAGAGLVDTAPADANKKVNGGFNGLA